MLQIEQGFNIAGFEHCFTNREVFEKRDKRKNQKTVFVFTFKRSLKSLFILFKLEIENADSLYGCAEYT